jgi:ribosome maturation factor RimP
MGTVERLHDLVAPICEDLGLELVDLEYKGGRVRVAVDREGGVDIDAIAKATRQISRALDEHDPIAGRYTLEVSSPGLERPLRTPAHFARAVGTKVRIKTRPGIEGERRVDGVLSAADDEGVTVTLAAPATGERQIRYDDIERARTVFEWGPAPKPGSGKKAVNA